MRFPLPLILTIVTIASVVLVYVVTTLGLSDRLFPKMNASSPSQTQLGNQLDAGAGADEGSELAIENLRKGQYPGSDITIEQTLDPGSNYKRYIASYRSEGLKIHGLLTVPNGDPPLGGWPVIIFNHGFIPPQEYRTTERYVAYVDGFARAGYIVFKSDYRGHGNSEGVARGGYGANDYTIDVLNAISSIKKLNRSVILGSEATPESNSKTDSGQARMTSGLLVNPQKIGMWGHSMGGFITLRGMVVSKDIKVGVIWSGVVGSYPDLINKWRRGPGFSPPPPTSGQSRRWRDALIKQYGTPEQNPTFWNSISANFYLKDISGPLELHHSLNDPEVPVEFSKTLEQQMKAAGKTVEAYYYPSDDHNLSGNFTTAMARSVEFFDKYLK